MEQWTFVMDLKMPQCSLNHRNLLWLVSTTLCIVYTQANIMVFSAGAGHQIAEFTDLAARFGGPIPSEGIQGKVVYASPATACQEIKGPPNVTNFDYWIVLIARCNCSFEIKVRMAQNANYDAVIIHNVDSNDLEPMFAQNPHGIKIPSVFVGENTGVTIRENYTYDRRYFILINAELPFDINTHLLLPFAIVIGICFLVMVMFMVIKCIKDRRRQRRHRLPNSSLKKIPIHKYTKGDPYEICAICLDDYIDGEKLRVLPCAHAYHSKCIDPWLTKNRRVCPVCKRKVFAADELVASDDSDSDADDATPLIRDGRQGTQGGTFLSQRENPFSRARRSRQRQQDNDDTSSNSSSSTSSVDFEQPLDTSDYGGNFSIGDISGGPVFLVSDTHSINGEQLDIERSLSSTTPHTVNLYTDVQEHAAPIVQITSTSTRNGQGVSSDTVIENVASSRYTVESECNDVEI